MLKQQGGMHIPRHENGVASNGHAAAAHRSGELPSTLAKGAMLLRTSLHVDGNPPSSCPPQNAIFWAKSHPNNKLCKLINLPEAQGARGEK